MSKIDNIFIVLVLALMCSFLPINLLIVISAVFVILHFYAVSMECAVVGGVVFLLMLLLYYRFAPKDALIVLLLPLCFVLKIPYAIPIIVGLFMYACVGCFGSVRRDRVLYDGLCEAECDCDQLAGCG